MPSCSTMLMLAVMLVVGIPSVKGYGSGAPTSACVTLQPGHKGVTPQQADTTPYTLHVSSDEYYAGSMLTVKIMGAEYGGFLLQARKEGGADTTPVGSWMAMEGSTQTKDCNNTMDSLTHTSSTLKGPLEFKWKAPAQNMGNIEFVATIAQKKSIYWMNHKSAMVMGKDGEDPNPEPEAEGEGDKSGKEEDVDKGNGADSITGLHPLCMVVLLIGCFF